MHSAGCELCQTGRRPAERLSRMFEDIRLTQCRKQRHAERIHHHGFADSRSHQAEQIHSQVSAIKADRSEGNGVETQALQQQRKIRGHDERVGQHGTQKGDAGARGELAAPQRADERRSRAEHHVQQAESAAVVDKTFDGSLPRFVAAFLNSKPISDAEAAEIRALLDAARYKEE